MFHLTRVSHGSLLRLLGFGCALVLTGACANGDDPNNSGFSITGVSNPGTNPTSQSASSTDTPTTSDTATTGTPPVTTSSGTTGEDASTTNPASGTTTTGVDPSTTTTGPDPSTTTSDDTTGVMMTTIDQTTGEPPPPPAKDPQPAKGPYAPCLQPENCDIQTTDTCLALIDANMNPTDGFCTLACDTIADCPVKPNCPAVQECLNIAVNPVQNICALKCAGLKDCPTGMACVNIGLPNNKSGMYCF